MPVACRLLFADVNVLDRRHRERFANCGQENLAQNPNVMPGDLPKTPSIHT